MDGSHDPDQQDTRYRTLYHLKVGGPQTVKELAKALAISAIGIRQHLVSLEAAGWVRHHREQRGLGRPKFVYTLTEQGDERHFPRAYATQMSGLLRAIQEVRGADELERLLDMQTTHLAAEYRERITSEELEARVRELASIRSEEGFMAGWEKRDDGSFLLWEQNCAVRQVAHTCESICTYEQELFRQVLPGTCIRRESHILSGDSKCLYVIHGEG